MLFCGSPISENKSDYKSVHTTSSSEGSSGNSSSSNNKQGNNSSGAGSDKKQITPSSEGASDNTQENFSSAGNTPNSKKEGDSSSKENSDTKKEGESSESGANSKKEEGSSSKENSGTKKEGESSEGGASSKKEDDGSSGESSSSGEESSGSKKPMNADNGISNIGLAVFKGDKFVGELTPRETLSNLIISNELKSCRLSITDPDDETKVIDMLLTEDTKPKIKVSILNGTPYVKVKVDMNARISSITNISDPVTDERISKIETAASQDLKSHILNYLYRTSKDFKSDISGIGKYAINSFKTYSDFVDYNWLEKYEDAFFSVETDVSIKSSFLLTGT